MKVKAIQVITGNDSTDKILLTLDAPTTYPTLFGNGEPEYPAPYARIETERGYGVEWATKVFPGVPIEVIRR